MPVKLNKEWFDNKKEQNRIKLAVDKAIPEGVLYANIVMALADLLREYTGIWMADGDESNEQENTNSDNDRMIEFIRGIAEQNCCETPGCGIGEGEEPYCDTMVARALLAELERIKDGNCKT